MPTNIEWTAITPRLHALRAQILELSEKFSLGHLGGMFSMLEALVAWDILHPSTDQFLLSKGHCVLAYYLLAAQKGLITLEDLLQQLKQDNGPYILHPSKIHLPQLFPLTTGSLGHALSFACGRAYAAKVEQRPDSFTVMLSDGELNVGQTWEALLSLAHLKLNNVIVLLDFNHWQALGRSDEVLKLNDPPLAQKLQSFGLRVTEVLAGNDLAQVGTALEPIYLCPSKESPQVVILHTIKGYSLPYLADTLASHYQVATPQIRSAWLGQELAP